MRNISKILGIIIIITLLISWGTQSIPYTLSGNSISYIRPDKGWNCSLEYTLTTTTLTITKSIENGRDVTSSRFPYVFTRK